MLLVAPSREDREIMVGWTYSRGFFLGPGLPFCLGAPSGVPFAFAAERFTPFFFGPSAGGPMEPGAGVPSACGVAAFESEALSPLAVAGGAGCVLAAGVESGDDDCLTSSESGAGESSICRISRSLDGSTGRLTIRVGLPPDFRRLSMALVVDGAMTRGGGAARERLAVLARG